MLSVAEFKALCNVAKSDYLRVSYPANSKSISMRGRIFCFGVNDSDYVTQPKIDGVMVVCPAYLTWKSMLQRVFDTKYQAKKPAYVGVTLCEEWKSFMSFRKWWAQHQADGWQLDKDLISTSRKYSPETCIFVPGWLNNFTINNAAARGEYPIGVHWNANVGKYAATCSHPSDGKQIRLGYFSSEEVAYSAWLRRKLEIADEFRFLMDKIDMRIYPRVVEIIKHAK